jgi:hypothetical protein
VTPTTPDHYEPPLHERVYYRHFQTGDRGYAVRRLGKDAIRKDRPAIDDVSYNLGDWKREADEIPRFSPIQISQLCFEADKKLCWALGHPDLAKRDWRDMTEKQRLSWTKYGPLTRSPDFALRSGLRTLIQDWAKAQK